MNSVALGPKFTHSEEQSFYRYKFKSTTNLSYVLFYEEGEGKVGPHLIKQEQEGE